MKVNQRRSLWPAHVAFAGVLLLAACKGGTDSNGSAPVPPAQAEAARPAQPQTPAPAPSARTSAPPRAGDASGATGSAPVPAAAPERALFDVIQRLVEEPSSLAELAPDAQVEDQGERGAKKHKLTDAKSDFGFLFADEHVQFAPPGTRLIDIRGTAMRCNAEALTCEVGYGGGETKFSFARLGGKTVLAHVLSQPN
jgi:hypothetical protein